MWFRCWVRANVEPRSEDLPSDLIPVLHMILLDTNIVSEVTEARPVDTVVAWLNDQDSEMFCVSTITIGEIAYGLRMLP